MFLKKNSHRTGCLVAHMIIAALLLLTVIASMIGIYKSHVLSDGFTFGTTSGSLAIIAFAVSITFFLRQLKESMGKCEMCSK